MVASFTVGQSAITPAQVTVTDTSTSVTGTITKRRLYISDAEGNYLTGDGIVDYDEWDLVDLSITVSVLTESTAANVRVDWLTALNVVVESLDANYPLSEFSKQFAYYLIQLLGLQPGTLMDSNYATNLGMLWTFIEAGDNAVTYGNDIAAGQNCYNMATNLQNNQSLYF
jgi:hypothetical protein